jgi:hypothetical protein
LTRSTWYSPPQPRTFLDSYAHQASSEPSHTRFCSSFPQHHSEEAYTDSKTYVQDPSQGKRFQNESFRILSHCHSGLLVWHLCASRSSTSRQDLEQNQTCPPSPKKEHSRIPRVIVHHNKDVPLPTRRSHTSWANKIYMEQLA